MVATLNDRIECLHQQPALLAEMKCEARHREEVFWLRCGVAGQDDSVFSVNVLLSLHREDTGKPELASEGSGLLFCDIMRGSASACAAVGDVI